VDPKTKVLILGGGFAGVQVARRLEKILGPDEADIQLVSRDNFLLFTPMLHEVAASDLDISTIVNPIRSMIRRTHFMAASVENIDLENRAVTVSHGSDNHHHRLTYDHLVLALGSATNFHGMEELKKHGLTMKSLEDAARLRNRMIAHLEEADPDCAAASRDALLTMVVAGGGFAGVETVAAMHDFLRSAIQAYPNLHSLLLRIVLIHSGPHLLPELGEQLGSYAEQKLRGRGIEVLTRRKLSSISETGVVLDDGTFIPTRFVVWTAGTAPSPQIAKLSLPMKEGRLESDILLRVDALRGIWAVGDCALIPDGFGGFHPPTAQHALREAKTAAKNIAASIRGEALRPLSFKTIGQLAAIGQRTGIARIFGLKFSGFPAWWMWRSVYLSKLPGFEKRVRAALNWTLDLIFRKDTVQYTSFRPSADAIRSIRSELADIGPPPAPEKPE
jgi:NADH dehydrogenase